MPSKEHQAWQSNRTEVADIDRSLYDFTYGEEASRAARRRHHPRYRAQDLVAKRTNPSGCLTSALKSLETYHRMSKPNWGPAIDGLDMDNIVTYVKPATDQKAIGIASRTM